MDGWHLLRENVVDSVAKALEECISVISSVKEIEQSLDSDVFLKTSAEM